MNKVYLYDGKFSSLLALIQYLIQLKITPKDIKVEEEYVPNLFDKTIYLNIKNKNEKIEYLKNNLSKRILFYVKYTFLSVNTNKEIIIYYFIINALVYKDNVIYRRNLNCVNSIIKISKYVSNEAHKLKGFLRFKKMKNNFYYAVIEPTNNILGIVANYFKDRLKNECWIIKDNKRNTYALYDMYKVIFINNEDIIKLNLDLCGDEETIQDLWKTFFKSIAIKERENLKCQRNFMPKKYWGNIIEMEDKI